MLNTISPVKTEMIKSLLSIQMYNVYTTHMTILLVHVFDILSYVVNFQGKSVSVCMLKFKI